MLRLAVGRPRVLHSPQQFLGASFESCAAYITRDIRIRVLYSALMGTELTLPPTEWCVALDAPTQRRTVIARQPHSLGQFPDSLPADTQLACYVSIRDVGELLAQFNDSVTIH